MSHGMETTITDQQLDALLDEKTMRRMTFEQLKYSLNGMICEVKRKRGFGWVEEEDAEEGKDRLR